MRAETFMLPVGVPLPSLKQLRDRQFRSLLADRTGQLAAGRTALETVGRAAAYGRRAQVSATVPAPVPARRDGAAAPAAVSYPDPARTMSLEA